MSRFEQLLTTVNAYQALAAENYDRIRALAEEVRGGLCDYLAAPDGVCVYLVPPTGNFDPRPYGDQAFSLPPRGFRPLGPISFGLAVRVSLGADWMRVSMECRKIGDTFVVQIEDGAEYEFTLPLTEADPVPFYEHVYQHVLNWFAENMRRYQEGDYGSREIGFDFADDIQTLEA